MKDNRLLDLLPGIKIQIVKIHNWGQNKFKALFGSCDGLRDRMAILADGSFSLCCADWNGKVVIGNAHIQTLKEVLQSKLAWKVISDFKHNRFHFDYCKKCRGGYDIKSWLYNQIHSTIFYNNKKEIER